MKFEVADLRNIVVLIVTFCSSRFCCNRSTSYEDCIIMNNKRIFLFTSINCGWRSVNMVSCAQLLKNITVARAGTSRSSDGTVLYRFGYTDLSLSTTDVLAYEICSYFSQQLKQTNAIPTTDVFR